MTTDTIANEGYLPFSTIGVATNGYIALLVLIGVYAKLKQSAELSTLIGNNIYSANNYSNNGQFPYLTFFDVTKEDFSVKDRKGQITYVQVSAFSRYRGEKELKQIMAAIYNTLHNASLTIENQSFVLCRFEFSSTIIEADGLTQSGHMRFKVITQSNI